MKPVDGFKSLEDLCVLILFIVISEKRFVVFRKVLYLFNRDDGIFLISTFGRIYGLHFYIYPSVELYMC